MSEGRFVAFLCLVEGTVIMLCVVRAVLAANRFFSEGCLPRRG